MKYFIVELFKFLKINVKKISILTLSIFLLIFGFTLFRENQSNNQVDINVEIESEDNATSEVIIEDIPNAVFHFYIENPENETTFTNNRIIEQYITLPEILDVVAVKTKTNINEIIAQTGNSTGLVDEDGNSIRFIGISRSDSTHLHTFYVNIGDKHDNLKIAKYFYNYFNEDNVPFLTNKIIYNFSAPHIVKENEEIIDGESIPIDESEYSEGSHNVWNLLSTIIKTLIIGFLGSTVIIFLLSFFSEKLDVYIFYSIFDEENFIIVDMRFDNLEELKAILMYPLRTNKVVLQETQTLTLNNEFKKMLENAEKIGSVKITDNFMNVDTPEDIERVIIIVEEGKTTRKWYNYQRNFSERYKIPTVIVQINRNN